MDASTIEIHHRTHYRYDHPVDHVVQRLRLTPRNSRAQRVLDWVIEAPGIETAASYVDGFANIVHLAVAAEPVEELEIVARGRVERLETHGVEGPDGTGVPPHVFLRATPTTAADAILQTFARRAEGGDTVECLHRLMAMLHERVAYVPGATDAATSAREAFAAGHGVCQDHAHIFIAMARGLGIPARYVTGYLRLEAVADEPAHHAWAEAHVSELGWVSFDPANNVSAGRNYVRLAVGLDAAGAAPVKGARRGGGEESLDVAVQVAQMQA